MTNYQQPVENFIFSLLNNTPNFMSSSTPYAPVFTREELSLLKLLAIQELEEDKDQSDTNERGNI